MTSKMPRTVEQDFVDQPQSLAIVLDRLFGAGRAELDEARATVLSGRPVIVTGMGGSYHVALPLTYHLSALGISANLIETGELVRHRLPSCRNAVIVVVSQSGETIETVQLLDAVVGLNAVTIGVTNEEPGALAQRAHHPLIVGSPRDKMVAMQTYIGTLAVLMALSKRAGVSERGDFEPVLPVMEALVGDRSTDDDDFPGTDGPVYFFGRGPSIASARAAGLLFHEMARMPAIPMSGGNFRHGPLEVMDENFRAIGFVPKDRDEELNLALAGDIERAGGDVRLIGPGRHWSYNPLPSLMAPLVEILPAQRLAIRLAKARGITPGEFRYGSKVTRTESGFEGLRSGR
ncbi:MAG: Glucosamine-6-phosphate deaminase, alternative [Rhizobium sp.]|nr:Glucosamine-6-phosphate deaminase, alternative [Rhizobium sp.]